MEFEPMQKIARFKRGIIITEKIDGTNAQIVIQNAALTDEATSHHIRTCSATLDGTIYDIFVGSRNKWITPEDDNFGFAGWVRDNAAELVKLGSGRHFGEWWGSGIQRRYGLDHKRFSLFNVHRWGDHNPGTPKCCHVVPTLVRSPAPDLHCVENALSRLQIEGSVAAPGFMDPEGVVVFHSADRNLYKVTLKGDEHKGQGT